MRIISDKERFQRVLLDTKFQERFSFPIEQHVQLLSYEPDEFIFTRGDTLRRLYYMVSGRAKLYLAYRSGKVAIVDFLDSPCYIGELEFFGASHSMAAVQAQSSCLFLTVPMDPCREWLLEDPAFLRHMCEFLSEKVSRRDHAYTRNISFPLKNRLAALILSSSPGGKYREKHTEIAEYLGVSYRQLMNVFAFFVREKVLSREVYGYGIADEAYLKQLAAEAEGSFVRPR